jgi:hypothetical protein
MQERERPSWGSGRGKPAALASYGNLISRNSQKRRLNWDRLQMQFV